MGVAGCALAEALQDPLKALQLVLKVGQLRLFHAQLVFSFRFVGLPLLLLGLRGFMSRLNLRKILVNLASLRQSKLAVACDIFLMLDFGSQVFAFILGLRELQAGFVEPLRSVRDHGLLRLQAVEENLRSLRGCRRVSQIHSQLTDLGQQSLQCLRVGRGGLGENGT